MPILLTNISQRVEAFQQIDLSQLDAEDKKLLRSFFIQCRQEVFLALVRLLESKQITYHDLLELIQEKEEYIKTGDSAILESIIQHETEIIERVTGSAKGTQEVSPA